MAATDPIRLGSALNGGLIFQAGSKISTTDSGIDVADIKALYAGGPLPTLTKGTPYGSIFSNGFLPDSFLLDKGDITYEQGKVLSGTITFKRQNPLLTGRSHAAIFVDSVINYQSILSDLYYAPIYSAVTGAIAGSKFGFPEPVVTVKYNDATMPVISGTLYALPGSSNAQGFPTVANIGVPYSVVVAANTTVFYYNGTTWVSVTTSAQTAFNFLYNFIPNPLGWQLNRIKGDPQSGTSFYDIELEWRNFYFFTGLTFINKTP